ncbi:TrmH family RNA methyltransferase [Sediminitomix flava]|uniref:tRNA (guanosine(18)-2'-O)-methyltransferase n=1 Tax=Sediminitomix flava TaxID=379075 RepID=A0A315Z5W1_SEDFL|nr:RNA methyltransferase [Sediminitomix flava]PWJ39288.1 tRNA (guanosine-2'-O-)-methyltransferase [Sediminitomix flava]
MYWEEKILDIDYRDKDLYAYLAAFMTENKRQHFARVLAERTRHVTVLLEDIYQEQNASAVIRSADCFGIQDVHVVEVNHRYNLNRKVLKGAAKWVDIHRYTSTQSALDKLKGEGFKLVATSPHAEMTLDELPVNEKVAFMMGTESTGLTDQAMEQADYQIKIPMYGFTESFNLSVSTALCLNTIATKLRKDENIAWQMSEDERQVLAMRWVLKCIRRSELHIENFYKNLSHK